MIEEKSNTDDEDDDDADDEETEKTPQDVIDIVGFDPAEEEGWTSDSFLSRIWAKVRRA